MIKTVKADSSSKIDEPQTKYTVLLSETADDDEST